MLVALRQAAVRLGADTITQVSYDQARGRILSAASRSRAPGVDRDLMPTLDQIEGLLASQKISWAQACGRAGLNRPARGQAAARVQAMDAEQVVAWFVQATGVAPTTFNQLSDPAAAAGVARKRMRASDTARAVAALQAARADAGLQPLAAERGRGPIERAAQAAAAAPRRRPKAWTGPAIIEGLGIATDHLQRGERLTQRALKRIAARHDGVPTYSVVQRHARRSDTTFEALIREAERLGRDR